MNDFWPDQSVFQRRKWLLIPINLMLLMATMRLPQHQAKFVRVITGGKISLRNLFLVSTIQAFGFTGVLIATNCYVIGVNPLRIFSKFKDNMEEHNNNMKDLVVADSNVIPGLPKGTKYSDLPKNL